MIIIRSLFKDVSILENNAVQTMASAGESLAAGIIFTVPSKSNKKEIDNDRENLIKFLRLELQNDLIELEVIVDKSTSKEYYSTPQEKFEKLNKINPLLDQFKKDLKLDL